MMCEHGHPQPARCALCRVREDARLHPEKYARPNALASGGVPRPLWFHAVVEDTRGMTADEAEQYAKAFVSTIRGARA